MTIDRDDSRPQHLREARHYTHDDDARIPVGEEWPSVTTICGLVDKSHGLIPWAVKLTADYWLEKISGASSFELDVTYRESKKAWKEKRDAAGAAGTLIHNWWNEELNARATGGGVVQNSEEIKAIVGAVDTCDALFKWQYDNHYTQTGGEFVVLSSNLKCAGRVDSVGIFRKRGKEVLTDLKTGSAVRSSALMQMGAYYLCLKEMGQPVSKAIVLHAPLGCKVVREVHMTLAELKVHAAAFVKMREVWSWFVNYGGSK